jgi:hypothetical protein
MIDSSQRVARESGMSPLLMDIGSLHMALIFLATSAAMLLLPKQH